MTMYGTRMGLCCLLMLGVGCVRPPSPQTEAEVSMNTPAPPWEIRYTNGSGDQHRLYCPRPGAAIAFSVDPVTPIMSSSGVYDGGPPVAGSVSVTQASAVWSLLHRLSADQSLHAEKRTMGTGTVWWSTPEGERRFRVQRAHLAELDALMVALKKE